MNDKFSWEVVRFKLVNFVPFCNYGYDEFEIDRRGSRNKVITILSANGAGKSMLATAWSPFVNDATNNRKRPVIKDGCEGIKEIDYISTNDEGDCGPYMYKCKIIYGSNSTNCSLIRVDMVSGEEIEMNENGLVTSYENIVCKIFGINKNYTTIGYLSPQITSLIGMKPRERYDHISSWLPDVSGYLKGYRIVQKKINTIKRQIKMIEEDLQGFSITEVSAEKQILENNIEELKSFIDIKKEDNVKLTYIKNDLTITDEGLIASKIRAYQKEHNSLIKEKHKLLKLVNKSSKYIGVGGYDTLIKDISENENKMNLSRNKIQIILDNIKQYEMKRKELEINFNMISPSETSLDEITTFITKVENNIHELDKSMEVFKGEYKFLNNVSRGLSSTETTILDNLIHLISNRIESISELISLDDLLDMDKISNNCDREIGYTKSSMNSLDSKIESIKESLSSLKNSSIDENILDLAPVDCNSYNCDLFKSIEKLLSPDDEITRLETLLEELYEKKTLLLDKIESSSTYGDNIQKSMILLKDINHSLFRDKVYISLLPESLRELLSDSVYKISVNINRIVKEFDTLKEFISIRDQHKLYSDELNKLKDKEINIKISMNMNSSIKDTNDKIDSLNIDREKSIREAKDLMDEYDILLELKDTISDINKNVEDHNLRSKKSKETQNNIRKEITEWYFSNRIVSLIKSNEISITGSMIDLKMNIDRLEEIRNKIASKNSLVEMRTRFISGLKELEILEKAWNPKTGIPSLFISNFLTSIHEKSNKYLKSLNGDDFIIHRFEIGKTSREFPIIAKKSDGTIVSDVSSLSDGQIAIVTLAISMAMISTVVDVGSYNIIRLDEVDGRLDSKRRKLFIDMVLETLSEINSKQCLIISHNDRFDEVETDVILLPGANKSVNSLSNKNVLFDISHIEI